jgi:hypothetical protein
MRASALSRDVAALCLHARQACSRALSLRRSGWRPGMEHAQRCAPGPAVLAQPASPSTPAASEQRGRGAQGAEDQGQHTQVWAHLPLLVHRARQAEEQGPHQPLPGQQVLHRVAVRARGAAPGSGYGRAPPRPLRRWTPPAAPFRASWDPCHPKQSTEELVSCFSRACAGARWRRSLAGARPASAVLPIFVAGCLVQGRTSPLSRRAHAWTAAQLSACSTWRHGSVCEHIRSRLGSRVVKARRARPRA